MQDLPATYRDGLLKGNVWKGLFHLPRMQPTCWNRRSRTFSWV